MKVKDESTSFRKLILIQIIVFIIMISAFQFQYYYYRMNNYSNKLNILTKEISHEIKEGINTNIAILIALAYNLDSDYVIDKERFNKLSEYYLDNFKDIIYIQHKDKETVTDMVYPLKGNEETLGKSLLDIEETKNIVEEAIMYKKTIVNTPRQLRHVDYNMRGLIIRYPIFANNEFNGFYVCVIDLDRFFEKYLSGKIYDDFTIKIFDSNNVEFYSNGDGNKYYSSEEIHVGNAKWTIKIANNYNYKSNVIKEMSLIIFLCITILILLIYTEIKIFNKNQNIEELIILKEEMKHRAYHDFLTNLPNKNFIIEKFKEKVALEESTHQKSAFVFLDLDDFKKINDTLGHDYGDKFLKKIANVFNSLNDDRITISRTGGDEFLVLISDINDVEEVDNFCNHIKDILNSPFKIDNKVIHSSASMGISIYPDNGTELTKLIRFADIAMYKAKSMGKNRYTFFQTIIEDEIVRKSEIEEALKDAIYKNELHIFYQPQLDLSIGKVIGLEALIRWKNEKYGWISPKEFIPIAESTGIIVELGDWVMKEVFIQANEWEDKKYNFNKIAINISAKQIEDSNFIGKVKNLAEKYKISPNKIQLEITEHVLLNNIEQSRQILKELKELQFTIALDDFGTGYSSLSYLAMLPVNVLKIDKSFIDIIDTSEDGRCVVKGIIKLAHAMNIKVIAEGVEKEEQVALLKELDCNYIQGYYYSKPITKYEIEEKVIFT